jgi:hypothetical protein
MQLMGSLLPLLKILQVPKTDERKGTFIVLGLPMIVTNVFPSSDACKGMINSPTDLTKRVPAGGSMTEAAMMRSCPMLA